MSLFVKAYRKREKDTAITYALMIRNAWEVDMIREEWMYITSLRQLEKLEPVKEKTKLDKIYNKALQYERYDIIVKMVWRISRKKRQPYNIASINQFYDWVQTYEKTGIEEYKDKATGKY